MIGCFSTRKNFTVLFESEIWLLSDFSVVWIQHLVPLLKKRNHHPGLPVQSQCPKFPYDVAKGKLNNIQSLIALRADLLPNPDIENVLTTTLPLVWVMDSPLQFPCCRLWIHVRCPRGPTNQPNLKGLLIDLDDIPYVQEPPMGL